MHAVSTSLDPYDHGVADVLCINGPNLDRLGTRDPAVYGDWSLTRLEESIRQWATVLEIGVDFVQSNHAGDLIDAVNSAGNYAGIVLNPGGLTHSSPALGDAVAASAAPVVEVHLSNVRARDRWRRRSFVTGPAVATIAGRGPEGYRAALRHLVNRAAWPVETHRYGPHPDQTVDLRRVEGATTGAVLIHGGFWLDAWGADTVESWAVDLARRGIPVANVEYRRLGSGGSARATTGDVARAVRAGAGELGLDSYAVIGHSAGGHLAAFTAGDDDRALTIAVSGIFDLAAGEKDGTGGEALRRFDPSFATSPIDADPPSHPVALIHPRSDQVVPVEQSQAYHSRLLAGGAQAALDLVDGGHFDALSPASPAWTAVVARLSEWHT